MSDKNVIFILLNPKTKSTGVRGLLVTYVRVWVLSTVNRIEWGKLSE
jgi:hypothetical protein